MKKLLILMLLITAAYSNVAKVIFFKGSADIIRDGTKIKLMHGSQIENKDSIVTYNNTRLQLRFKDNTLITIGKNSSFEVYDFLYKKGSKKVNASFGFKKGLFRTVSGQIGKINPNKFKIKIRNSSIGIRGTKFDIFVDDVTIKIGVIKGIVYFELNNELTDIKLNYYFIYNSAINKYELHEGIFKESEEFKEYKIDTLTSEENNNQDTNTKNDNDNDKEEKENIEDSEEKLTNDILDISSMTLEQSTTDDSPVPNQADIEVAQNLQKEVVGSYDDVDYGYWQDTNQNNLKVDTFSSGTLTPDVVIDDKINTAGTTASYSGEISSIITNTDGSKIDSTGTINLNIDFSNQNFTGDITITEGNWKADINSGDVTSSNFSSSDITTNAASDVAGISGDINGNFFGTDAAGVGGDINLNSTNNGSVKASFAGE